MELYASGFNAWNQLRFLTSAEDGVGPDQEAAPEDVRGFNCVLQDDEIGRPTSFLSHTVVDTSSGSRTAGYLPAAHIQARNVMPDAYSRLVEAGNDHVATLNEARQIVTYPSVAALLEGTGGRVFSVPPMVVQLVAYHAGFAALTSSGSVWTWGDKRYAACLARDVTSSSPEAEPGLVTALEDLPTGPIAKIAAGGYLLAALTRGNDLYCWGGRPGQSPVIKGLTGDPSPVVVKNSDVIDVGVGESHMILLTHGREVFIVGTNENGQLGLRPDTKPSSEWAEITLPLEHDQIVTGVAAGPRNSFILVRKQDSDDDR